MPVSIKEATTAYENREQKANDEAREVAQQAMKAIDSALLSDFSPFRSISLRVGTLNSRAKTFIIDAYPDFQVSFTPETGAVAISAKVSPIRGFGL